jgi:accessory gene regulator B
MWNRKVKKEFLQKLVEYERIEEDKLVIYEYGFDLLIKKICHIMLIIFVAFLCNEVIGVVLFLLFYADLREYSGGYHAKSSIGCYFCTAWVTVFAIILIKLLGKVATTKIWSIVLFCGAIIWILSPQDSENKPFLYNEKELYRQISHRHIIVQGIFALSGVFFPVIANSVGVAWTIQAIMLVVNYFKKNY